MTRTQGFTMMSRPGFCIMKRIAAGVDVLDWFYCQHHDGEAATVSVYRIARGRA